MPSNAPRSAAATYSEECTDLLLTSKSNGGIMTYLITPEKLWWACLNLAEIVAILRITASNNATLTTYWQYTPDGRTWKTTAAIIAAQTTANDYYGAHSTNTELPPCGRLVVDIAGGGSAQGTAVISMWGYRKYRV